MQEDASQSILSQQLSPAGPSSCDPSHYLHCPAPQRYSAMVVSLKRLSVGKPKQLGSGGALHHGTLHVRS